MIRVIWHPPAATKLGHNEFREVDEGARGRHVGQIEAVYIGLLDPALEFVGYFGGRAHQHRATTTDADFLSQFPHRPSALRRGGGKGRQR